MDYSANAISRRFELLESQWMEFQKRSTTPDLDEEPMDFPSSLASLEASGTASLEKDSKPWSAQPTSDASRRCQDSTNQPDSPLTSSSSTLSSTSSSSSSCSDILHSDSLNSRRKRLFSEPHTPIKEAILDSSRATPTATKLRESRSFQPSKTTRSHLSDHHATSHQSRSPPPGTLAEEVESTRSKGSYPLSNKGSSRSLASAHKFKKQPEGESESAGGSLVLHKLRDSLVEVLMQLESKEKCLRDVWMERKEAAEISQGLRQCSELESLTTGREMAFSGLSSLVEQSSPGKWSDAVSKICQRLSSYLQKETLLQKWAIAVEKEVMRVLKLEEDIVEAKVHTAQELEIAKQMKKSAEDRSTALAEDRDSLAKDRESLYQWVEHLQDRQKAVHDREQEVALSMEELKATAIRLEEDQELMSSAKLQLQEREKEVETQLFSIRNMQEDLQARQEQAEKEKSKGAGLVKELELKLKQKDRDLQQAEADLADKVLATENLSKKLVTREKALNDLQTKVEREQHVLEVESELSKKNGQELITQATEERKKVKRFEEKLKAWEEALKDRDRDLMRQESSVRELECQLVREQEQSEAMHEKLANDQEAVLAQEDDLKRKEILVESKNAEARKELERLNGERKQVSSERKRLNELEVRINEAERALEVKKQQHETELEDYHFQVQDLEAARSDLEVRAAELQRRLQHFQNEKRTFETHRKESNNELELILKEKDKLNLLQRDIEMAGAEMRSFVTVMDKASAKLDAQRRQIDTSQKQLKALADRLTTKHKLVTEKEKEISLKEELAFSNQNDLRRRLDEVLSKEKNLRSKENELAAKEKVLHELEAKVTKEIESIRLRNAGDDERILQLEKSISEKSQALAKAEKSLFDERSLKDRSVQYEKERLKEQADTLAAKKKEMTKLEAALKRKEEIMEEQGSTLVNLEFELKERMQRIDNLEKKSYDLEKGWEGLREEHKNLAKQKEYLGSVRVHMEQLASNQKAELLDLNREREELRKLKEGLGNEQKGSEQVKQALRSKETKAAQRELALAEMERKLLKSRNQVEKDADDLKQKLAKAHTELQARKRYVEDRQNAVDAAVLSLKEVATKVNARKREVEEREQLVQMLEERQRFIIAGYNVEQTSSRIDMEEITNIRKADNTKEMETLKAQQLELEKTKQAVHDAKSTLTVQLKASKRMVADASLIAQQASSEREALVEERRLLVKERQEIDRSLLEREMQAVAEENARKENSSQTAQWRDDSSQTAQWRDDSSQTAPDDQFGLPKEERFPVEELRVLRRWPRAEEVTETERDVRLKDAYSLMLDDSKFINMLKYSQELPQLPSQKRLENVMSSLVEARQASRSRLRRTENALLGLPSSSPSTREIREALRRLSERLSELEQIEEGLACQLKEAYEAEFPELEGALVDKVELLCKMEDQQNLRAEWEQDMQKQLERINRLQASSSDCFDNMMSMESVERALSPMLQPQEFESNNRVLGSPDWNVAFDRLYQQPKPASPSPLGDMSGEPQQQNRRQTRRKLLETTECN